MFRTVYQVNFKRPQLPNQSHKIFDCCGKEGDLETLKKLIEEGEDVNKAKIIVGSEDDTSITPLFEACVWGHVEIVKELLKHPKIEVNTGRKYWIYDTTPLMQASAAGNLEIVLELVKHPKIDLLKKNNYSKTYRNESALDLAKSNDIQVLLKALIEGKEPPKLEPRKKTSPSKSVATSSELPVEISREKTFFEKGETFVGDVCLVDFPIGTKKVVGGYFDGKIRIFDSDITRKDNLEKEIDHGDTILSILYVPEKQHVFTLDKKGFLSIWDVVKLFNEEKPAPMKKIQIGKWKVSSGSYNWKLFRCSPNEFVWIIGAGHGETHIASIRFSDFHSEEYFEKYDIRLLYRDSREFTTGPFHCFAKMKTENSLLFGGGHIHSGTIVKYNFDSKKTDYFSGVHKDRIESMCTAILDDGFEIIVSGGNDRKIGVFNSDGKVMKSFDLNDGIEAILKVDESSLLVAASKLNFGDGKTNNRTFYHFDLLGMKKTKLVGFKSYEYHSKEENTLSSVKGMKWTDENDKKAFVCCTNQIVLFSFLKKKERSMERKEEVKLDEEEEVEGEK